MQKKLFVLATLILILLNSQHVRAQGIIVSAAGPVNRSMGGAATAAPIDALGAIYWNPATITHLPSNEMEMGLDLLFANHTVRSSFGPFQGVTQGEAGVFPIPNVGWVHKCQNPNLTIGLGVNGVAGFKTNLNAYPTNPILAPQPIGLGRVSSEASFMQLAPVLALQLTDTVSLAVGPTKWNDRISLRSGYTFNQNPISNQESFFNVASPLICQHMISTGASLGISESTSCHVAYSYMFENTRSGPLYAPGFGAVPGSSVDNTLDRHFLSFGVSLHH